MTGFRGLGHSQPLLIFDPVRRFQRVAQLNRPVYVPAGHLLPAISIVFAFIYSSDAETPSANTCPREQREVSPFYRQVSATVHDQAQSHEYSTAAPFRPDTRCAAQGTRACLA